MDPLPLASVAQMAGAKILRGSGETVVSRVGKDTRTIQPSDLYVALRGENFDGNAFAAEAASRGAAAVLVDTADAVAALPDGFPVLLADNGLAALTRLAAAWRTRLDLKVLCITGSNGKTTTKDFAAAILGTRFKLAKTEGNLNNHIGVPLSILAADSSHTAAVWEIGMNHPGEIAPLAALARPDAAIITNFGIAHIEYMKSRAAIAVEKGALAEAVPPSGFVILPAGDSMTGGIAERCRARVILTGLDAGDLTADSLTEGDDSCSFVLHVDGQSLDARIPSNGSHMVANALHAIAAGIGFGLSPAQAVAGLASARLAGGRLERRTIRGISILDDSYNANPDSMIAALSTLRALPGSGHRIAVLGRMGELGEFAAEGYRQTGLAAGKYADILVTVGAETASMADAAREAGLGRIHEVEDTASAARMLAQLARPGDIILVKGSRSARMENVLEDF
ncbi:MAG: UDP-N-acetylmuramoyl-tripeptide--D-alanyl-D-alanine ligase [Verrucomicrobiaceae bacterium]|nr:MAG: UDP-N-acetylmuramoyl-tripeptide--D-alanyl-D-alanine ligase [Verrucomicrobiaceae bacterium]